MAHRILLATFGSLGDLHPYLGLARALRERGHAVTVGATAAYREAVEQERVGFLPVRPDHAEIAEDPARMARAMDLRRGSAYVIRELVMPHVRDSYTDLASAVAESELVVAHPFVHAAPAAAEAARVPWLSVALQPSGLLSAHDPAVLPVPLLPHLRRFGPLVFRPFFGLVRLLTARWLKPVDDLHDELGLPRPRPVPTFGRFSPHGTLALFSSLLARPQPDWPPRTRVTGFVWHDAAPPQASRDLPAGVAGAADLERFLDGGPPPVVFTLGSSAVMAANGFFDVALRAARTLAVRSVLLVGRDARNLPPELGPDALACAYAPFGTLFPRAAAVVHQGGVGTTGQALRAGRPMLVVPFSHDQPDNAFRVERLGVARILGRSRFRVPAVARELGALLEQGRYSERAEDVASQVRAERGVETACTEIEALLNRRPVA